MAYPTTNILAMRPLQIFEDDQIVMTVDTSLTANDTSVPVDIGGIDTSFYIYAGATGSLTAQGNLLSPSDPSFSASWFNIVNISAPYFTLVDKAVRYVRIKGGASSLTGGWKCAVYSSLCNNHNS